MRHDVVQLANLDLFHVIDPVLTAEIWQPRRVGLEQRAEYVGVHDIDLLRTRCAAQGITLDLPRGIELAALFKAKDVLADGLEGDDGAGIVHAFPKEVMVLADIRADIEHAVDLERGKQLAQMRSEVTVVDIAAPNDVVAKRMNGFENAILKGGHANSGPGVGSYMPSHRCAWQLLQRRKPGFGSLTSAVGGDGPQNLLGLLRLTALAQISGTAEALERCFHDRRIGRKSLIDLLCF